MLSGIFTLVLTSSELFDVFVFGVAALCLIVFRIEDHAQLLAQRQTSADESGKMLFDKRNASVAQW